MRSPLLSSSFCGILAFLWLASGCAQEARTSANETNSAVLEWSGVWNPSQNSIEWKRADAIVERGHALGLKYSGLYSPRKREVQWVRAELGELDGQLLSRPVTMVLNLSSGEIEQRTAESTLVAVGDRREVLILQYQGVYDGSRRGIDWRKDELRLISGRWVAMGFAGVYDPMTRRVLWQQAELDFWRGTPVVLPQSGSFNEQSRLVEWRTADLQFKPGGEEVLVLPFTGVYNPYLRAVEWMRADVWVDGEDVRVLPYAGVFDSRLKKVEWRKAEPLR
jgi:hypothetical protein